MSSRKCTNLTAPKVGRPQDKVECGAVQFYKADEQCPKFCAHCGGLLNPDFIDDPENVDKKTGLKTDGPTILEWVGGGYAIADYPPPGYTRKDYTQKEFDDATELEEANKAE